MIEALPFEVINDMKQNACIFGTLPDMNTYLFKILNEYKPNYNFFYLNDINFNDNDFLNVLSDNNAEYLFFVSNIHSVKNDIQLNHRTIEQIYEDRISLEKLLKSKKKVDSEKESAKPVGLFIPLEHPYLLKQPFYLPEKIESFLNEKWRCYIFPFNSVVNKNMVDVSSEIIKDYSDIMIKRFETIVPCLYEPGQYESIRGVNRLKKNVFFASVKPSKIDFRYEYIKIDSLQKIKKEYNNYDLINCNRLANNLYYITNHVLFESEFLGAIRSSAETQESYTQFELYPLSKLLERNIPKERLDNFLKDLNEGLKKLYDTTKPDNVKKSFPIYQKHIFPYCAIIAKTHLGQVKINEKISDSKNSDFSVDNFWKLVHKKSLYCKISEISPSLVDKDQFSFTLVPVTEKYDSCIRIKSNYKYEDWREILINKGITEGTIIELKDTILVGTLFFVYDIIIDQVQLIKMNYDKMIIQEKGNISEIFKIHQKRKNEREERLNHFINTEKILLINEERYFNPLYLLKKFALTDPLLLENTGAAHGDLNLDNILLHITKKDDMDNNQSFPKKGSYELKFIDLSSFDIDYPLSFDYVKLEVEIKNHILSWDLFSFLNSPTETEDHIKKSYTNIVLLFEKRLRELSEKKASNEIIPDEEKFTQKMNCLFPFLVKLRKSGIQRYDRVPEAPILYAQQLFFYSLRSMMYETEVKIHENIDKRPIWRRRWAFLGALVASESFSNLTNYSN